MNEVITLNIMGERAVCSPNGGACCIALEVRNEDGSVFKPADIRCSQLRADLSCAAHDATWRPKECADFTCVGKPRDFVNFLVLGIF